MNLLKKLSNLHILSSETVELTSFEFDGTIKSFQDAIYKLTSENRVMNSSSIQWISMILNYFCDKEAFDSYDIANMKGVLISRNELPFCYIKNQNPKDTATRYIKISYESIRSVITNVTMYDTCLEKLCHEQTKTNYIPSANNVKSFMFGVTAGVIGVFAIVFYSHSNKPMMF